MKKNGSLIHVRLSYDEALEGKRDTLSTELDLIRIAQAIKKYKELRLKELNLKIELNEKINNFKNNLKKLRLILPKMDLPPIVKKFEEKKLTEEKKGLEQQKTDTKKKERKIQVQLTPKEDLEIQLQDIQEKLGRLG